MINYDALYFVVYAVEAIRCERVCRGKLQYLIKWRDYDEKKNSWEPACNILDDRLVALWQNQQ
jgi:Chromo (CHRromatin Organisation MOdifier) domain